MHRFQSQAVLEPGGWGSTSSTSCSAPAAPGPSQARVCAGERARGPARARERARCRRCRRSSASSMHTSAGAAPILECGRQHLNRATRFTVHDAASERAAIATRPEPSARGSRPRRASALRCRRSARPRPRSSCNKPRPRRASQPQQATSTSRSSHACAEAPSSHRLLSYEHARRTT